MGKNTDLFLLELIKGEFNVKNYETRLKIAVSIIMFVGEDRFERFLTFLKKKYGK